MNALDKALQAVWSIPMNRAAQVEGRRIVIEHLEAAQVERSLLITYALAFHNTMHEIHDGHPDMVVPLSIIDRELAPYLPKPTPPTHEELMQVLEEIGDDAVTGDDWAAVKARVKSLLARVPK